MREETELEKAFDAPLAQIERLLRAGMKTVVAPGRRAQTGRGAGWNRSSRAIHDVIQRV